MHSRFFHAAARAIHETPVGTVGRRRAPVRGHVTIRDSYSQTSFPLFSCLPTNTASIVLVFLSLNHDFYVSQENKGCRG